MVLFSPATILVDGVNVDKAAFRNALLQILNALGGLPDNYAPYSIGEAVVLGDDDLGPAPASSGVATVGFAGRRVGYVRTQDITLGSSLNLTDNPHLGAWLKKTSSASCLITVEPHADPMVGVLQDFKCAIWRRAGSGSVQVTSSMTNTHLSGHTRVASNGVATLTVDTVLGEWSLHGETAA